MIVRFTWIEQKEASISFCSYSYKPNIGTLPSDNLVNYFLLFQAASSQIDTCSFNAFVSHEVSEQGYVVELLQEILGIAMAERVRVNHFLVQAILHRMVLQLL